MKKFYVIFLFFYINYWSVNAQSPAWLWAKSAGGTKQDYGTSIATDANGNVLVTGYFESDSITFGTTVLTNTGPGFCDIFVVKYDVLGNVLWAKSSGGPDNEFGAGIATDDSGNVFIIGEFESLDIAFGTDTLSNSGSGDMFIVKYDAMGNTLWAKSAGGVSYDYGGDISVDGNGNVLITGFYYSPSIIFGATVLTNINGTNKREIFIAKYDASGNVLWAKSSGGYENDWGRSISGDANGNVLVTGQFESYSITFGSTILYNASNPGDYDMFMVKYDSSGNVLWANSEGGPLDDAGYGICTDANGNSLVTGFFASDSITFGTTVLINSGVLDIFIVKYDSSGNALWAKSAGGTGVEVGADVSTDGNDNVLVTGTFQGDSITFGTTTLVNSTSNYLDVYFVKYDASGNFLWAKSAGGNSHDQASGICTDVNGNVLVVGSFASDSISFGNDQLINAGSQGTNDIFVAKLDSAFVNGIAAESNSLNPVTVYPNPSNGQFRIVSSENMNEIKIFNLTGQIIYRSEPHKKSISLQLDEAGIYFIQILMKDQIVTKKIIVSR